ncbi:hypothetical protein PoB_002061800 [Plakobranchus ocellatus]|uniref:Uncharacterized protein n=1 Tax=Plakobranchus ocellatus TaxID=259542 RepID=A0AAV3ZH40_9GAST|nr:hypothetical protein PoB_002061800 [Plakobranchus ocellatus]
MKDQPHNSPGSRDCMTSSSNDTLMNNDRSECHVITSTITTSITSTTTFPANKVSTKHVTYGDSTVVFMTPEQSPMTPDIGVKDLLAAQLNKASNDRSSPLISKKRELPARETICNNNNNNNNNTSTAAGVPGRRSRSTSPSSRHASCLKPDNTQVSSATKQQPGLQSHPPAGRDNNRSVGVYGSNTRSPTPPPVVMRTSATSLDRLSWKGYRPPSEEYYDVLHPEPRDQT